MHKVYIVEVHEQIEEICDSLETAKSIGLNRWSIRKEEWEWSELYKKAYCSIPSIEIIERVVRTQNEG
jgi:hypothetical protein